MTTIDGDVTENISQVLNALAVPAEFGDSEPASEPDLTQLEEWRRKAHEVLNDLRTRLAAQKHEATLEERALVVSTVAQYDGEGPWVQDESREVARAVLLPYETADYTLPERILSHNIRPIFQKNPHPGVNLATGRRLARPVGGSAGALDFYEGQEWKQHPGMLNTLSWCVRHIEGSDYERLWHLVIPPVMTLLDDYQVRYKVRGVCIVSELLERVPPELLRRTGMDSLMLTSLNKCFTSLRDPDTPELLRMTTPVYIRLIELTTPPKSAKRFDELCTILGDGIIGSVWVYSTHEPEVLQASLDVLPAVVTALGVGASRYLKALIPQLVFPLMSAPDNATPVSLQLSSATALRTVILECAPRMTKWRNDILNGVCRCWVALVEPGTDDTPEKLALIATLQKLCQDLGRVCPSVIENEYARLLEADRALFAGLVVPASAL